MIKIEDKLYYSIADIIRLFQLTPLETFNSIADSAGEVKLFYVYGKIVKADSVFKFCRIKNKKGTQIEVPYYYSERLSFVDEQLMKDLQTMLDASPYTNKGTNIVQLANFGDSSINILVSAYLLTNAYAEFLQMQNDLNLNIMDIMQADGVDFAFPSTSVYIEKN